MRRFGRDGIATRHGLLHPPQTLFVHTALMRSCLRKNTRLTPKQKTTVGSLAKKTNKREVLILVDKKFEKKQGKHAFKLIKEHGSKSNFSPLYPHTEKPASDRNNICKILLRCVVPPNSRNKLITVEGKWTWSLGQTRKNFRLSHEKRSNDNIS